jgi:peptidoglycan/LPS O-acetylase OafA/YrhL
MLFRTNSHNGPLTAQDRADRNIRKAIIPNILIGGAAVSAGVWAATHPKAIPVNVNVLIWGAMIVVMCGSVAIQVRETRRGRSRRKAVYGHICLAFLAACGLAVEFVDERMLMAVYIAAIVFASVGTALILAAYREVRRDIAD